MEDITLEMVEKYLLGDFDVAKEILRDLADGTYTVENWKADLLKANKWPEYTDTL